VQQGAESDSWPFTKSKSQVAISMLYFQNRKVHCVSQMELFYSINFFCTESLRNKETSLIQTQFWMRSIFIFPGKVSKFLHTDEYSTVNIPGDTIFCSNKEEVMFHTWKKIHFSFYLFCKRHGGRFFMFTCLPVLLKHTDLPQVMKVCIIISFLTI